MVSPFVERTTSCSGFDFVRAHFQCEENPFSERNPDGYVNLGSAQNHLHTEDLQQRLATAPSQPSDMKYQPFTGKPATKDAVAEFLSTWSARPISSDDLVLGNGLISLLEALAFALLNEEDHVLVPTPVFPALITALSLRTRGRVARVPTYSDNSFRLTPDTIERAIIEHRANGNRVRAILLCSPGNPVGQVFNADELSSFLKIAESHDCVLIVDEVYAASCFEPVDFSSALMLGSDRIFVLGGISKDFGLAGHAAGWLHGLDSDVMTAVRKQSHFFRLPTPVQTLMEHILEPTWRQFFAIKNRIRLTTAFQSCAKRFHVMDVSVTDCQAGLCLWFDLRNRLAAPDIESELSLYRYMLDEHRVHISPGTAFHCVEPGFYRICFSQRSDVLTEGLNRISNALSGIKAETI